MKNQDQKHVEIIPMSIQQPTIETIQVIIEGRSCTKATKKRYTKIVEEFMGMGYIFTPNDVMAYMSKLNNSASTINGKLSVLKAVSGILHDEGKIPTDDRLRIARIRKLKANKESGGNWLSKNEVIQVINGTELSVIGERDKALISMLFATGLRRAEIRSLTWNHLSWKEDSLEIRGLEVKGGIRRNFVVQHFAINPLLDWSDEVSGQFELETNDGLVIGDFPVFLSVRQTEVIDPSRKGLSDTGVTKIVDRCGQNVGLSLRPHDCRRTFASLLYDSSVDVKLIQSLLGHSTISMTERYLNPIIEQAKIHDRLIELG